MNKVKVLFLLVLFFIVGCNGQSDANFAKDAVEKLQSGDIGSVNMIDWDNFIIRVAGVETINVGQYYKTQPNSIEQENFKRQFVSYFSQMFNVTMVIENPKCIDRKNGVAYIKGELPRFWISMEIKKIDGERKLTSIQLERKG